MPAVQSSDSRVALAMRTTNKFLRPSDVATDRDVVLVAPFWGYSNRRYLVELVMMTVDLVYVSTARTRDEVFNAAHAHGRPFSLKICGQGWIRLEQQLGRDLFRWENRGVSLVRATKGRYDYIAVRELDKVERERFGRFA